MYLGNIFVAAPIDFNSIDQSSIQISPYAPNTLQYPLNFNFKIKYQSTHFKLYIPVCNSYDSFWVFLKCLCTFLRIFCDKRFQNMF